MLNRVSVNELLMLFGNIKIYAAALNLGRSNTETWWRHQMKTFSVLLDLCAGNSPVPVNSSHKGQWRGALIFSLIFAWVNGWGNNREAGDLRPQSRSSWRHCNEKYWIQMVICNTQHFKQLFLVSFPTWRRQAITWTNFDVLSTKSSSIQARVILLEYPIYQSTSISLYLKFTHLKTIGLSRRRQCVNTYYVMLLVGKQTERQATQRRWANNLGWWRG